MILINWILIKKNKWVAFGFSNNLFSKTAFYCLFHGIDKLLLRMMSFVAISSIMIQDGGIFSTFKVLFKNKD